MVTPPASHTQDVTVGVGLAVDVGLGWGVKLGVTEGVGVCVGLGGGVFVRISVDVWMCVGIDDVGMSPLQAVELIKPKPQKNNKTIETFFVLISLPIFHQ
jgi:hypothetical protein